MMTRKDYVKLADAFNTALQAAVVANPETGAATYGVELAMQEVRKTLARDNGRFDDGRFVEAARKGVNETV